MTQPNRSAPNDVDFAGPEFLNDPWRTLRPLQDGDPMFWSDRQQGWIVTRHDDVHAGTRDPRLSAQRVIYLDRIPGGLGNDFPNVTRYLAKWVAVLDPPAHSRVRTLMMRALSRDLFESLRPFASTAIDEILDGIAKKSNIDFVKEISAEVPSRIISKMVGIDESMRKEFIGWVDDVQQSTGATPITREVVARLDSSLGKIHDALRREIADRRKNPRADIISAFVKARDADDRLSDDELESACSATVIAGFDTTLHMISLGTVLLSKYPDSQRYLFVDYATTERLVDELLRYCSMLPALARFALEDFEWHGKTIRKGDMVFLMIGAANHDERVWTNPDEFDPTRPTSKTSAFGGGFHLCLGRVLARIELCEFYPRFFSRFRGVELLEEPTYPKNFGLRGFEKLKVTLVRK